MCAIRVYILWGMLLSLIPYIESVQKYEKHVKQKEKNKKQTNEKEAQTVKHSTGSIKIEGQEWEKRATKPRKLSDGICRALMINTNKLTMITYLGFYEKGSFEVFDTLPASLNSENIIHSNQNRGIKTGNNNFIVFTQQNGTIVRKYTATYTGAQLNYQTVLDKFQPAMQFRPYVLDNTQEQDLYFDDVGYYNYKTVNKYELDSKTGQLLQLSKANAGISAADISVIDEYSDKMILYVNTKDKNIEIYNTVTDNAFTVPTNADPTQLSGKTTFFGGLTSTVLNGNLHIASVGVGKPVVGTVVARANIASIAESPTFTDSEIVFSDTRFSNSIIYAPAGVDVLYGCSNFGKTLTFWVIHNAFTTSSVPTKPQVETPIAQGDSVYCDKIISFSVCTEEIYVKLSNGDVLYSDDGGMTVETVGQGIIGDITGVTI